MTTIEKLRSLARDLAGEAWDYKRRHLAAQAHVRRKAAKTVMKQAEAIQREDAIFEEPPRNTDTPPRDTFTRQARHATGAAGQQQVLHSRAFGER